MAILQVSKAANKRYFKALFSARKTSDVIQELEEISNSVKRGNYHYSGFNLISKRTTDIFSAILNGRNIINGFRNKDIRLILFSNISDEEKQKYCNKITKILSKLRAFGLIIKIRASFRYKVTMKGYRIMIAALRMKSKEFPDHIFGMA